MAPARPPSFLYAVKASRYLTHLKKLKEPGPPVALFFSRARTLGRRLGPVLYQLPPRWPRNLDCACTVRNVIRAVIPTRLLKPGPSGALTTISR